MMPIARRNSGADGFLESARMLIRAHVHTRPDVAEGQPETKHHPARTPHLFVFSTSLILVTLAVTAVSIIFLVNFGA